MSPKSELHTGAREEVKTPNQSGGVDVPHLILAAVLVAWGIAGVVRNKVVIGARGSAALGFQDGPAWLAFGAITCGAVVLVAVSLRKSHLFASNPFLGALRWLSVRFAWCFFAAAVVSQTFLSLSR